LAAVIVVETVSKETGSDLLRDRRFPADEHAGVSMHQRQADIKPAREPDMARCLER
jgi:hypothetical protein